MIETTTAARSAGAFRTAMQRLVLAVPGALHETAPNGTLLAFTGGRIPLLNTVMSVESQPDDDEIEDLVAKAELYPTEVPWTLRLRGDASARIAEAAARSGLANRTVQPFMVMPIPGPASTPDSSTVRQIPGAEYELFAETLGAAFGAPPFVISELYTPAVLDLPEISAYLVEDGGKAVAAGLGVVTDGHLGLINIATRPEYRRRGHARALVETIVRDGRDRGAQVAYLHPSDESLTLFQGAGFRTVEHWTLFAS